MKKGDIIKYNSNFDFNTIPKGSILKIINIIDNKKSNFISSILLKVQENVNVAGTKVIFFNIDTGNYWSHSSLDKFSFEIIRYGAK